MMAKSLSIYQQRKADGKCVRQGCDRKPLKNEDGTRRSYCPEHNAMNRKNSDAWAARQPKVRKAKKVADPVKRAPIGRRRKKVAPLDQTVPLVNLGTERMVAAELPATQPATAIVPVAEASVVTPKPRAASVKMTEVELAAFNSAVAERQQRTGCSRKIAAQYIRRQPRVIVA